MCLWFSFSAAVQHLANSSDGLRNSNFDRLWLADARGHFREPRDPAAAAAMVFVLQVNEREPSLSPMKTATIRDLRNHMPRVAHWIDQGETVQITRRGEPFARLIAEVPSRKKKSFDTAFKAHASRLKAIWGTRRSIPETRAQQLDQAAKGDF